ncbi:MAG TPA: hypothetical protein VMF30_06185 [Pirellulales bacterium]|nr:hypothetical protein [Pirellulales bacterium]
MIGWFLKLLGISDEVAGNFAHAELRWGHGELAAIGLALLLPAAWLITRRQRRNLPHVSPRARNALSVCRIGVLLLLVMVLGAPYLHTEETLDLKPLVALIVDDSASMSLPAGPFDPAEARALAKIVAPAASSQSTATPAAPDDAADVAWRKQLNAMSRGEMLTAFLRSWRASIFEPLADKFALKVYRVARHVRPTTLADLAADTEKSKPSAAETNETDLGGAIRHVIDDAPGRRIAGIVLATDGRSTTWPDPIAVARSLVDLSPDRSPAPVFAVPIGSERPLADVAVVEISLPAEVAKDDTVSATVTLASQGFDGRKVAVELHDGDGPALSTAETTLAAGRRQSVLLNYHATEAGNRLLRATVAPLAEETVAANNSATAHVRVGREPARLLYLEGTPRWDFRFLDHALRRDKAMNTTFVVESQLEADAVPAEMMPEVAGLSKVPARWAENHVVLLGDVSPRLLPPGEQRALVKAVEEDGLGLVVQCGTRHMPWDFVGSPLAAILPMTFDAASPVSSDPGADPAASPSDGAAPSGVTHGLPAPIFAPFRMLVTPAGATHPAFAITGNISQDRALWSGMPEFFWAAPGSRLKPAATRLADIQPAGGKEKLPILAEQVVGRGRVLVVGCDETFRWRRNVGDRIFYRFWGQALRHVARKPAADGQLSWLEVEPQTVEPGTPVSIDLYAVDEARQPIAADSASVAITAPGRKETVRLERIGEAGHFHGSWTPEELGVLNVAFDGGPSARLTATVEVASSHRELALVDVDRAALETLAEVSGGELIEPAGLAELPDRLAGETVHQARPYEDDLWDNWLTLLLLAGLYCADVGIRRVLGLI